jgi:hypothetical protein
VILTSPSGCCWARPVSLDVAPVDADGQSLGCERSGRFGLVSIPREAHAWPTPEPLDSPPPDDPPDLAR